MRPVSYTHLDVYKRQLLAGVPIDQVSILLGHSSVKTTERHYAPFVKARQEQLVSSVEKSWQLQGLHLVEKHA